MAKKPKTADNTIAQNKKARHDFFIEEDFEAGMALEGWEAKSLREGRAQLKESYVIVRHGALWLFGAHFSAPRGLSTHVKADPTRTRKLLLHKREIDYLIGSIERKGMTVVPLSLYWKRGLAKLKIGLAKGKKQHDKRQDMKERDWNREKQRLVKMTR